MQVIYDKHKYEMVLIKHGIDLEVVKELVVSGNFQVRDNDSFPHSNQKCLLIVINNYPVKVPFRMIDSNTLYIITAFNYRKWKLELL